jgi:hypothetical protein
VKDQMLLKKFEITCNLSFDGTMVGAIGFAQSMCDLSSFLGVPR